MARTPIAAMLLFLCSTASCTMGAEHDLDEADWAALSGVPDSPHWLILTARGDTALQRQPGDIPDARPGVDVCWFSAGTRLLLSRPARREGNFLELTLQQPVPGCPLSQGPAYLYEPHVADGSGDSGFLRRDDEELVRALERIFAAGSADGTRWSVDIRASPFWSDTRYILYQRDPDEGVKPASTLKLFTAWAAFETLPALQDTESRRFLYVRDMMKRSDNEMAEVVLGWAGGRARVGQVIDDRGLLTSASLHVADASGLSYSNRLSARDLVQSLLWVVRRSGYIRPFRATLPVGGRDGTLAGRLELPDGIVAAKTGTLARTTALAGLADATGSGWQVVFAVLGDSVPDVERGRQTIDRAIAEVVSRVNQYP